MFYIGFDQCMRTYCANITNIICTILSASVTKSAHCTLQLFRKEVTNCRIEISLSKENLTRNMMNTSRAPLAESEDFDNLSVKSLGNSAPLPNHFPDQNHNDVRKPDSSRKRIPPAANNNNSKTPVGVAEPFPTNVENFHDERDHVSFCNPALMLGIIYCCGAMFFLVGMNVEGLTLLRYPWIGNLLSSSYQNMDFYNGVIILQVMWCVHFVRKSIQVLFMNRYHGQIAGVLYMCMLLYYSLFGLLGWLVNEFLSPLLRAESHIFDPWSFFVSCWRIWKLLLPLVIEEYSCPTIRNLGSKSIWLKPKPSRFNSVQIWHISTIYF